MLITLCCGMYMYMYTGLGTQVGLGHVFAKLIYVQIVFLEPPIVATPTNELKTRIIIIIIIIRWSKQLLILVRIL